MQSRRLLKTRSERVSLKNTSPNSMESRDAKLMARTSSQIRLSPTQRQVVDFGDGPLLVVAGPGTGKTRVLTERVRRLLSIQREHFRVLALTFTNKAAREMEEPLADLGELGSRTFIGTLHG